MADEVKKITDADLKALLKELKPYALGTLPASKAARADLLFKVDKLRLAENKKVAAVDKFQTQLEQWFIQELPNDDARGILGQIGRVEIKRKERPTVEDWDKFYAFVHKNKAFELMGRALNAAAIKERWEAKKIIPGVGKFTYKTVSLTAVKGK